MLKRKLFFFVIFLLAFGVYAQTLYGDVGPTDSGELTFAAWTFGIPHSPGFPVYILLGWLWTHGITIGSVAWRLNLFSAIAGAGAVGICAFVGNRLAVMAGAEERRALLASAIGGLFFAAGFTLWSVSTVAEVYALNTLILTALVAVILSPMPKLGTRICAGILFGMSLGVHPVSAIFLLPLLLLWFWRGHNAENMRIRPSVKKFISAAAIVFLVAFVMLTIVYLVQYIRATQDPAINWADPSVPQRFWWHITARQYQTNFFSAGWMGFYQLVARSFGLWIREYTAAGWMLGMWGLILLFRKNRLLRWGISAAIILTFAYMGAYNIHDDWEAYYLPIFLFTAMGIVVGVWDLIERFSKNNARRFFAALMVALLVPSILFLLRWREMNNSAVAVSSEYARNMLSEASKNAVILTTEWQLTAPVFYAQGVENTRTDVLLIDLLLWQKPWYVEKLRRIRPEIRSRWQPAFDDYLQELRKFIPGEYWKGPEIYAAYRALLFAMLQSPNVYVDVSGMEHLSQYDVSLPGELVPTGLLFGIYDANNLPRTLPDIHWQLESITSDKKLLVSEERIRDVYSAMLLNRAGYFEYIGDQEGASAARKLWTRLCNDEATPCPI